MTREEAIKTLRGEAWICCPEKWNEALETAIEALGKDFCDNAISRRSVLNIVDSYSDSRSNVEDVTQDIISDVMALPPVTSQQKKCGK